MKSLYAWLDGFCAETFDDPKTEAMFRACFLNTYETTVEDADGETYVFTGDIPAMWLRDSSAQVIPYLHAAERSAEVRKMIAGLLTRQFRYIQLDPYANAFNKTANGHGHKDVLPQSDWVWERKFEIDSLCYPLWLACKYYAHTGDTAPLGTAFVRAVETALDTFTDEQRHHERSDYAFIRVGDYAHDTLPNGGKGDPIPYTGMIWSAFRPSDDRCTYNYFVPGNIFAATTLRLLTALPETVLPPFTVARCRLLAQTIEEGIARFGVVDHPLYGKIYAYEVDGKGNVLLMDDANVPNLLGLPYLGYCSADDPVYRNTRKFILSKSNPYYFCGRAAAGLGSPHTPDGWIWHIGLIMQALTASDADEKRAIFDTLLSTHADTAYMHESFDKDDPARFTRPWFAWANSLFAYFVIEDRDALFARPQQKAG